MAIPTLLELAVDRFSVALRFSEALSTTLPSINRFAVLVNGVRVYASSTAATLSNDGTTIRFSLRSAVAPGASVAITYTSLNGADRPGFGDIRSLTNDRAAFFRASATANLSGTPTTPSVTISSAAAALKAGETTTITFTFSRDPGASFTNADITLAGGTLSTVSGTGLSRTATFTPTAASSGNASITVAAGTYTDVFGNSGGAGTTPALAYDTLAPTVTISDNVAGTASGATTFTFTFSEAVTGFSTSNITVGNGSKGTFSAISSSVYTLVVTPPASSAGTITIDVSTTGVTDAAGNQATAPAQYTQAFDTLAPTVTISDNVAGTASGATTFTFTFSEVVTGFSTSNVTVGNGTKGTFSGSGTTYTLVVTPPASSAGTITVDVSTTGVTDAAGNQATAPAQYSQAFDTIPPTLAITSSPAALTAGQSATITFTFSETPAGFTAADVISSGGNLTGLAVTADPKVYTATFTADSSGSAAISVAAGSYTDVAGNAGGASFNVAAGTLAISGLGSGDGLVVASGAMANATVGAFGLIATSQISNAGTANLTTAGYAVNLTTASGPNGYAVTNTGAATTLTGSAFNDTLSGGAGADTLVGGPGSDTYIVDSVTDTITEGLDAGTDTIQSSVTFTLADTVNVENLTLSGSDPIDGSGDAFNNLIIGNDGDNSLSGGSGNDTLSGGAGIDTLVGGPGADTYIVDSTADTIIEEASDIGLDTIQSSVPFSLADTVNVENLTLSGSDAIDGSGDAFNNLIIGNAGINYLSGGEGDDDLRGGSGDDNLSGDDGNDTLTGGEGNDTLTGGLGNDVFTVDAGSDTILDLSGTGDSANALIVSSGATATAGVSAAFAATSTTNNEGSANLNSIGFNVDLTNATGSKGYSVTNIGSAAIFTGSNAADRLTGGSGNDTLTGQSGDDTLAGGNANDSLSGGDGSDSLSGGSGNDALSGDGGNDTLFGGSGIDTLTGGAGVDVFQFFASQASISGTTSPSFERITDLVIGTDQIDGSNAVISGSIGQLGSVGADLTSTTIEALLTTSNFPANGASIFTHGSGGGLRTFLALNNATAGYLAGTDNIIEITGYSGNLSDLAII
jgi:Ca2+-binding RTX toxin-like protein